MGGVSAGSGGASGNGGVSQGGSSGTMSSGGNAGAAGAAAGSSGVAGQGGTVAGGAGVAGNAGVAGTGGASGSGGSGGMGGTACQDDAPCQGFTCCNGVCANTFNDIFNCGTCGTTCDGPNPYCRGGVCTAPNCEGAACGAGEPCCGTMCCGADQLCCDVTLGPSVTACFDRVNGTCPMGCNACVCAAPTTPIATPSGARPISELAVGDLVYSIHQGRLSTVPLVEVHRQPVTGVHRMVEVVLEHGVTLHISPRHPTADGRLFADLTNDDTLDGVGVARASLVSYGEPYTYDILPDSDSASYFAGGVLIGSTLAPPWQGSPSSQSVWAALCAVGEQH